MILAVYKAKANPDTFVEGKGYATQLDAEVNVAGNFRINRIC